MTLDSKQALRVQERIETIQNQEIAALKKVIKIQRAIIKRNGAAVSNGKLMCSPNSNINRKHPSIKGESVAGERLSKGMKRYEAPTVCSILHMSPKLSTNNRLSHFDLKSGAAIELQEETKKILSVFGK